MVFLFVDMFDNLSLPICHISSFTQHGFTMSESLETQRQGGFSTCVLKVFKVMRVAFFFFYHSKVMMPRNVRDAHRQSRGALPLLVRGRWLKHWVPNTAELAVARSCWHGCRDPSPVFITTVLNVVSLLFIYFFSFYYGHIHCHPARPWQKNRLGEDAWLWTNPAALFIYLCR